MFVVCFIDFGFCQSLVIAFVTPPTPRVVDSAAFVTSTVLTQFWKKADDFFERFTSHGRTGSFVTV